MNSAQEETTTTETTDNPIEGKRWTTRVVDLGCNGFLVETVKVLVTKNDIKEGRVSKDQLIPKSLL